VAASDAARVVSEFGSDPRSIEPNGADGAGSNG
jgi:hypothetical protein